MSQQIQLIRRPEVELRIGRRRSGIYAAVSNGTLPPPVNISARAVAWIAHEIDAVLAARMRGSTEDEIRILVAKLIADRKSAE